MDIRFLAWAGYDFKGCPTVASGVGSGSIQLEYGWQLVAIPIEYGYWSTATHEHVHDDATRANFANYVKDQIEDLYATPASGIETIVEVANTYLGDNQFFWSYVVGSTPSGSPHNFQMMYDDGIHKEVSGFWIKIIGTGAPYIITWGDQ